MRIAMGKHGGRAIKSAATLVLAFTVVGLARGQWAGSVKPARAQNPGPSAQPQPPSPPVGGLEDMLAKALQDNPDIRVAQTKVSEAEAELNRTRLQVLQKVIASQQALGSQKAVIAHGEAETNQLEHLAQAGRASSQECGAAKTRLVIAKAKLAEIETEMQYLIGRQPPGVAPGKPGMRSDAGLVGELVVDAPAAHGAMADRIREALDTIVTVEYKDKTAREIFKDLQDRTSQPLNFQIGWTAGEVPTTDSPTEFKFTVALADVPVGAVLHAMSDATPMFQMNENTSLRPTLRFVVREYGLLATKDELPPGALLLQNFWKGKTDSGKKKPATSEVKKP